MTTPVDPATLRVGTDERNAAIRCLDEHLTAGRLDAEEYGDRVAAASLARTRGDISPLFLDLPTPHPFQPPPAPERRPAWQRPALTRLAWLVLAAALTVLAFVSALTSQGFHGYGSYYRPHGSSSGQPGGRGGDHFSGR